MCYLYYFILFYMFDDYWGFICRSQISAGKSTVKTLYFWSSENLVKYTEVPILSEDGGSQKGRPRWARRGPHHPWARAPPWPRPSQVWCPWPTSGAPPSRTSSPRNPKTRGEPEEIFHRLLGAETTEREKALRQGEICQGNSFPEGGDHRHPHRHRAGLHRDHHHHHLHRHHHHHRCTISFRCNI